MQRPASEHHLPPPAAGGAVRIIQTIQKNRHIKLAGNEKLRIRRELPDPKARAQMVLSILRSLEPAHSGLSKSV